MEVFAGLSAPWVALTRKGIAFAWTDWQQVAFDTLKTCLLNAPILGFLRRTAGLFWIRMPAILQWGGGGWCSTSFRRIGRSSSHMLARVFICLNNGIALLRESTTVLHYAGSHVYSFPVVPTGSSVYSTYGPQFTSVAAEVLEQ